MSDDVLCGDEDALFLVLGFLDVAERARAAAVNKRWFRLASTPFLWREVTFGNLPLESRTILTMRALVDKAAGTAVSLTVTSEWVDEVHDGDSWLLFLNSIATNAATLKTVNWEEFEGYPVNETAFKQFRDGLMTVLPNTTFYIGSITLEVDEWETALTLPRVFFSAADFQGRPGDPANDWDIAAAVEAHPSLTDVTLNSTYLTPGPVERLAVTPFLRKVSFTRCFTINATLLLDGFSGFLRDDGVEELRIILGPGTDLFDYLPHVAGQVENPLPRIIRFADAIEASRCVVLQLSNCNLFEFTDWAGFVLRACQNLATLRHLDLSANEIPLRSETAVFNMFVAVLRSRHFDHLNMTRTFERPRVCTYVERLRAEAGDVGTDFVCTA